MSVRFILLLIFISSLSACSSTVSRAPVFDITGQEGGNVNTTSQSINNKNSYQVEKGDTLYGIAWKTGVDANTLIQKNNLKPPYIIQIGQTLHLSGHTTQVAKKITHKSDLSSQNKKNSSNSDCTGQNCLKNNPKAIAQEKTKAYSTDNVDKRSTVSKVVSGNSQKVSSWQWPVKGKLTEKFSASPSEMQGISIVNDRATPVYAAASGQVVYAGNGLRGYGNLIIIKHNFDYLSAYAHNETLLVREDEVIKKGQKIATMGDSGTGFVHLHFEIRYRGKSVDPLRYLPKR